MRNGLALMLLLAFCPMVLGQGEQQAWTVASSGTQQDLWGVTYDGDGTFYAVGQGGTILYSRDGTDWLPRASGTTAWLLGVAKFLNLIVAVGEQGTVLRSFDSM